jgi:hypothetical protein
MSLLIRDILAASDEELLRLLAFALDRDPAGPRLKESPPVDRAGIIQQLCWLGILTGEASR